MQGLCTTKHAHTLMRRERECSPGHASVSSRARKKNRSRAGGGEFVQFPSSVGARYSGQFVRRRTRSPAVARRGFFVGGRENATTRGLNGAVEIARTRNKDASKCHGVRGQVLKRAAPKMGRATPAALGARRCRWGKTARSQVNLPKLRPKPPSRPPCGGQQEEARAMVQGGLASYY